VPNLKPYQLATGKNGNPLAAGKPFVNNFLPNGGDMLRLNMAVPVTKRTDPKFSSLGLIQAAVLGLTDTAYNQDASLQAIPNMDGFPNGRRLEDDVTRIELQAVSGVVLAAIGLWYDDYPGNGSPVTPNLLKVLTYNTGVNANDTTLKSSFPYVQTPWPGTCNCSGIAVDYTQPAILPPSPDMMRLAAPDIIITATPNPVSGTTTVRYRVSTAANVVIQVTDGNGNIVGTLQNGRQAAGTYNISWNASGVPAGIYFIHTKENGVIKQTVKIIKQ
jgi:hypothetical protein